jgi:hypothetical protein
MELIHKCKPRTIYKTKNNNKYKATNKKINLCMSGKAIRISCCKDNYKSLKSIYQNKFVRQFN